MGLSGMEMDELRALGWDLEPLLDREVRGRSRKDLETEVKAALEELKGVNDEAFDELCLRHFGDSTADAASGLEEASGDSDEPEAADAGETPEKAPGAVKPAAKPELSYAIQIRQHATAPGIEYGIIVINPTEELRNKYIHAVLSEEGVKRLVAAGSRVSKLSRK